MATRISHIESLIGIGNRSDAQKRLEVRDAVFSAVNISKNGIIDKKEFKDLCRELFKNEHRCICEFPQSQIDEIFNVFDLNEDGYIDEEEFKYCWEDWIEKVIWPISALLIVDVQNDFISGTLSLSNCPAKQNAEEIIAPINKLLETVEFDAVVYSLDWHPDSHLSFVDNLHLRQIHSSSPVSADEAKIFDTVIFEGSPPREQRLWPRHCVKDSWGAKLHSDLKIVNNCINIYKGTNPEIDSYSAFEDNAQLSETALSSELKKRYITDIYICGLATDVCVAATARHSLNRGYRTILVEDCCRGVDLSAIEKTKNDILANGGIIIDSSKVKNMVEGIYRHPDLGYKLALDVKSYVEKTKHSYTVHPLRP